ncbi:hypothetical protein PC129_g7209 [Phytophthora cactorum]|uniref:RxLR effector protein n=1 Tax=Phytophthora cactorum TaxID=29920 RepID=A0A329T126_9STRA|nr:hypothetical protein Pcac1_g23047 [Phytophthora cactorum]KAG2827067.1 hypothetical protein PC112_g8997 [Phytophthora cactorum]KAG2842535.1 hypothetical protein PC111_g2683 [Phytophthora cactorum]KAG2858826.1 hypothetical protein PC113_g9473 [Phytophthora cactorum]KAG2909646.1 hypothetical protein PC114_g10035 [Phytophthora cactorum]
MRVHYIALLVGVLAATACADLLRTDSKITTPLVARSPTFDRDGVASKRGLRAHKPSVDNEERGIFDTVDDFVKNLLKEKTGWAPIDNLIENVSLNPKIKEMLQKNTPVDDAFIALEVDKATGNLLDSQQWKDWAVFIIKRNKKDPDESLASALSIKFGLDGASKILATAAKDPKTKEIATKLEEVQLKRWLDYGFKPDQIFNSLNLNEKVDNIFESPQFATWVSFLTAYNKKNTNKKDITELDVLLQHYKEDGLVKLLSSADNANNPRTQKYLDELFPHWLDQPTHPQNIFNMLKLDEAGDGLLTSPLLSKWVEYMKAFNEKYSFAQTGMIKTFTRSYGDEKLATMLQAAAKASDVDTAKIAKNLQEAQFKHWMNNKLTPDDVYKTVLKLESTSSPNADIWRAYYNAYDTAFPGKQFSFNPK